MPPPSARGPQRAYLRQGLDREVHQIIARLLERGDGQASLDVSTVYAHIQRSNSSLKRKGKPLLEDSIERALAVVQDDQHSEDDDASGVEAAAEETKGGDAMNQSIMRSMLRQANKESASASTTRPSSPPAAQPNGEAVSKKRREAPADAAKERQTKRSRWKEAPNTDPPSHVSLRDFGGSEKFIRGIKESIMLPLLYPHIYTTTGVSLPRGVLLHGPPGCGKTMLAEAIANAMQLPFLKISAPSIVSGMSGESEKQLRQVFEHAISLAPCLVFIDEIDAITPKRESSAREMEKRIVAQLLTCMDDLALEKTNGKPVIVLAATNRPDSIDSALRRAGRFDKEINVGVPDVYTREKILRAQTRAARIAPDVDFGFLAKRTPGFVGADLGQLTSEAGAACIVRALDAVDVLSAQSQTPLSSTHGRDASNASDVPMEDLAIRSAEAMQVDSSDPDPLQALFRTIDYLRSSDDPFAEASEQNAITMSDFVNALSTVQPSYKREGFATVPDTTWADVGALDKVRKQLQDWIVSPIQDPESFARLGLAAPAGVLLWGPPGCGKTLLAKAVANESQANFISVKGPELLNKYVGESERAVRQVFLRARSSRPCIIFFDELDALVPKRDAALTEASSRVVNTLLTELDGLDDRAGIYVIGATNRPDTIDPAMLRPGRLGQHVLVELPGAAERQEILRLLLRRKGVHDAALLDRMARIAHGADDFSGADISSLVYNTGLAMRSAGVREWSPDVMLETRRSMSASNSKEDLRMYSTWKAKM